MCARFAGKNIILVQQSSVVWHGRAANPVLAYEDADILDCHSV